MEVLRFALPKGRIFDETVERLRSRGARIDSLSPKSRLLMHRIDLPDGTALDALILRAQDVPTYIERGICSCGITGLDVLMEQDPDLVWPLSLSMGQCRMSLAMLDQNKSENLTIAQNQTSYRFRVATKFPNIAKKYFENKNKNVEIVELKGSVETAPLVGLADAIIDIVETGETLKQNGLAETEILFPISARFVANRAFIKTNINAFENLSRILADSFESN